MKASAGFLLGLVAACGLSVGCGTAGRGNGDGGGPGGSSDGFGPGGCMGLQCQIQTCPTGTDTVLVGELLAPNGKDPVPGAQVYVPALGLPEFPSGVSCDLCSDVQGAATQAQTGSDGKFVLPHVPVGNGIPVVFQLGRFRRVLTLDVASCVQTTVPADAGSVGVRLPHRDAELDPHDSVPHVAIATGDYDQIECVLKRMGLDQFDLYSDRDAGQPPATVGALSTLLADATRLSTYNILVVNCTNNQFEQSLSDPSVRKNIADFVTAGGRLYATDWAYDTIEQVPEFAPYLCFVPQSTGGAPMCSMTAEQAEGADSTNPYSSQAHVLDTGLADWLTNFPNVIDGTQHVSVDYSFVVIDQVSTSASYPTTVWVEGDTSGYGTKPLTVTFDYASCGRVHFSTYNTEPNGVVPDNERYPSCKTDFSPQERILEYLVFEIASCVGPPG